MLHYAVVFFVIALIAGFGARSSEEPEAGRAVESRSGDPSTLVIERRYVEATCTSGPLCIDTGRRVGSHSPSGGSST